ncbi:unnamed protein product [Amoebophrya sp. A120]|nr:unnamed protein product [Amoebophrya sp. A120]|eukprot:GSA120T00007345001.1
MVSSSSSSSTPPAGGSAGSSAEPPENPLAPGTEFGDILQHACKIKGEQMTEKRKRFESLPLYLQHTLFFGERKEMREMRLLSFQDRMKEAMAMKQKGNELFSQNNCADAVHEYEKAAGLFAWVESRDPAWKNSQRGIDDDVLVVVIAGEEEEEKLNSGKASSSRREVFLRSDEYFELVSTSCKNRNEEGNIFAVSHDKLQPTSRSMFHTGANADSGRVSGGSLGVKRSVGGASSSTANQNNLGPRETSGGSSSSSSACPSSSVLNSATSSSQGSPTTTTASEFRETCALNIAACYLKSGQYYDCRLVCTAILQQMNPSCVKALYRRAQCHVASPGSGSVEIDCAIADLGRALELQPGSKEIRALYQRCREEKKEMDRKSKQTFKGKLFSASAADSYAVNRNENSTSSSTNFDPLLQKARDRAFQQQTGAGGNKGDPMTQKIHDAMLLRDLYQRNGKFEEARKLDQEIEQAKRAMKQAIDYANPTQEMIEEAKQYGLDLLDPVVQRELLAVQERSRRGEEILDEEDSDTVGGQSKNLSGGMGANASTNPDSNWWRYFIFFLILGFGWRFYATGIYSKVFELLFYGKVDFFGEDGGNYRANNFPGSTSGGPPPRHGHDAWVEDDL